jgi:sigma-E factor negative regulatory protein RseA
MDNNREEIISALVDDEAPLDELDTILSQLEGDAELQYRWQRYNLISDALHNNLTSNIDTEFHKRISTALEDEPAILAPRKPKRVLPSMPWFKQAAGLGIAASVTAVAIFSVQNMQRESGQPSALATAPSPNEYVRIVKQEPANKRGSEELDAYLVNHNELSSTSGIQGTLPYARVVSHEVAQ